MLATFRYLPQDTPIHRLDPRTKLTLMLCFALTAATVLDLRLLLVLLAIALTYYLLARLPWRETRAAWAFFSVFIVFLSGINTLLAGQRILPDNDVLILALPLDLKITWQGILQSVGVICRMLIGVLMALPITFTIRPSRYGVAFRGMGFSDSLAVAMDLAVRLIPAYAQDFQHTIDAQRARGYELESLRGGLVARIRRLAPLVVPVTINAILSGEDIINALEMRGFGRGPRTWIHARSLPLLDRILVGAGLGLVLTSIAWRLAGGGGLWVPAYPFS